MLKGAAHQYSRSNERAFTCKAVSRLVFTTFQQVLLNMLECSRVLFRTGPESYFQFTLNLATGKNVKVNLFFTLKRTGREVGCCQTQRLPSPLSCLYLLFFDHCRQRNIDEEGFGTGHVN